MPKELSIDKPELFYLITEDRGVLKEVMLKTVKRYITVPPYLTTTTILRK